MVQSRDVAEAVEQASVSVELNPPGELLKWRPIAVVEKFSEDQVTFVRRQLDRLGEATLALRNPRPDELGDALRYLRDPSGDELRALAGAPEDGVFADIGNLLTTAGLNRLTSLWIAGGGQGMTNTATRLGVGNGSTAAAVGDTDLSAAAGSANRWFQVMDATYPSQSNGVVTAKATFATGDANFAWQEWALDIGTPTVSSGNTVNANMVNRKVASLGTKVTGSWALTVTITIT